jgi:hypothetical protein
MNFSGRKPAGPRFLNFYHCPAHLHIGERTYFDRKESVFIEGRYFGRSQKAPIRLRGQDGVSSAPDTLAFGRCHTPPAPISFIGFVVPEWNRKRSRPNASGVPQQKQNRRGVS